MCRRGLGGKYAFITNPFNWLRTLSRRGYGLDNYYSKRLSSRREGK